MHETTGTPTPHPHAPGPTPAGRSAVLPPSHPDRGGSDLLLGVLLVLTWPIAGAVALLGRLQSCGGLKLGYSTGGPPTAEDLSTTATMFVIALLLGLTVPAIGVLQARRHDRSAAGWAALGVIPIVLTALTLPPVVHASMVHRPAEYCVDPGYHGG